MLHDGSIAEMKTGEGKTLVSTLAAYLNALTSEGVHGMCYCKHSESFDRLSDFLSLAARFPKNELSDP